MKKFFQVSIVIGLILALALGMVHVAFGASGGPVHFGAGWNNKAPAEQISAGWNSKTPPETVGWCTYCNPSPDAGWNS